MKNQPRLYHAVVFGDRDGDVLNFDVLLIPAFTHDEALLAMQDEFSEFGEVYLQTDAMHEQAEAAGGSSLVTSLSALTHQIYDAAIGDMTDEQKACWIANMTEDGVADGVPFQALYRRVYHLSGAPTNNADPYEEAKRWYADGVLEFQWANGNWEHWTAATSPNFDLPPHCYRRRVTQGQES